jgi:hypothetical protein
MTFLDEAFFKSKHLMCEHLRAKVKEVLGFFFTLIMIDAFWETFVFSPVFGVDPVAKTMSFYGEPETEYSFYTVYSQGI